MLTPNLILGLSLFLTGFSIFMFIKIVLSKSEQARALSWGASEAPEKSKSPLVNLVRPLVHQFTLKYSRHFKNDTNAKQIEHLLLTSGLNRELNVDEFIGLKIFWGVLFPVIIAFLNFTYEAGLPFVLIPIFGVAGWMFPNFYAKSEKKKREIAIRNELPFFADLLALSTEAGLDFVGAIKKIVDKAQNSTLSDELGIVLKDITLGASRSDALRGLSLRCDIMEITSFVAVLIDADSTGASISKVLKDQSEQIRLERFVRAEKAGAKASQLILFPIVFFIVPAVFIVIFGPVALNMMFGGDQ